MFEHISDEKNKKRLELEARVMRHFIRYLKKNGWECYKVYDGGENVMVSSEQAAMDAICAVDEAYAYFRKDKKSHYIYFVRGNAPWEVVSDWSYAEGDPDGFNKLMDAELLPYTDKIEAEARKAA